MSELPKQSASVPVSRSPLTTEMIKQLGGIRPMTVASDEVYVFGEWSKGGYPVEISRQPRDMSMYTTCRWQMRLFGFTCIEEPTAYGVFRLLNSLGVTTEQPQ